MKKKALIALLAALTAGSFLLLSGCGTDQPNNSSAELSAEMETEHLSDGTVQMHSVWYNADNSVLTSATVTLLNDNEELFSGTTDESGVLEACSLPGNTPITCKIADSTGSTLAEGEIIFKISNDYTALTIYPVHEESESEQHVLEIPSNKTDFRAAVFITSDGSLSFSNLSPYTGSSDETEGTEENAATDQTGADAAADQAGTDAASDQNSGTDTTQDGTGAGTADTQNPQDGTQAAQ